jgi:threonine aldolase
VLGGGWRQAGLLAAMANYALDHNVERLKDDHRRAEALANALRDIPGIEVNGFHTSMAFITIPRERLAALSAHMTTAGIKLSAGNPKIRLVMHLDIDDEGLARIIQAFRNF